MAIKLETYGKVMFKGKIKQYVNYKYVICTICMNSILPYVEVCYKYATKHHLNRLSFLDQF